MEGNRLPCKQRYFKSFFTAYGSAVFVPSRWDVFPLSSQFDVCSIEGSLVQLHIWFSFLLRCVTTRILILVSNFHEIVIPNSIFMSCLEIRVVSCPKFPPKLFANFYLSSDSIEFKFSSNKCSNPFTIQSLASGRIPLPFPSFPWRSPTRPRHTRPSSGVVAPPSPASAHAQVRRRGGDAKAMWHVSQARRA